MIIVQLDCIFGNVCHNSCMMSGLKKPITQLGLTLIENRINSLKAELPIAINNIQEARRLGDLSENHEYHSAQKHKSYLQNSVLQLEDYISSVEVREVVSNPKFVAFGTKVLLEKNHKEKVQYIILGDYESEVSKGSIAISSPVAQAMLNKTVGDTFSINGNIYSVLAVSKPSDEEIKNSMIDT